MRVMNPLLRQGWLICLCWFALAGPAMADSMADAHRALTAKDYAKAEKLFRQLAGRGNAEAQDYLGYMYYSQSVALPSCKETVKWNRLAADQGKETSQNRLAEMYYKGICVPQDYKESAKWNRLAAERGSNLAQSLLAEMYAAGQGVPQDYVLAHMWANIASANTDYNAIQEAGARQRDSYASHMTAVQIAKAQELARTCTASKFKGC